MTLTTFLKSMFSKKKLSTIKGFVGNTRGESLSWEARDAISFFESDPMIFGACNNLANWISSTDSKFIYKGKSSGRNALKQIEKWAKEKLFKSKIRNWALTHVIFDDVFIEIDEEAKDFYILDSETVKVVHDKFGRVLHYEQNSGAKRVTIPAEKIVHFKMNSAGSEVLGISPLVPLNDVLKSKRISEEYTDLFFKRNATPRLIYHYPDTYTDDEIKAFQKVILSMNPHADLALPAGVTVEKVGSQMQDMQFQSWLQYIREQILVAMGLFPILIGLPEGSNKANSNTQFDAFRLRVRAVQNELQLYINTKIIPRLFGTTDVEFVFEGISLDEYKKKADIELQYARAYGNLVKFNIYSPEDAKKRFEEEVSRIG